MTGRRSVTRRPPSNVLRMSRIDTMFALLQRDGPYCACGCGAQVVFPLPGGEVYADLDAPLGWGRWAKHVSAHVPMPVSVSGNFTVVAWTAQAEIEHKIPLWKVKDMPDGQRGWYFGLGNLALWRPDPCHKRKSGAEAAERAHLDRLAAKQKPGPLIGADGVRLV